VLETMTDSSAMRVTLTTKGQTTPLPTGRATYVANKGTLIFLASNLEPLQPAKTYELWLIPAAEGQNPIPAGTFHPDGRGNASVIMPPLPKGVEAKAFGVTVEDEGGASTPTMPIILVGE
jgi:anti-sigma-K factor RskA